MIFRAWQIMGRLKKQISIKQQSYVMLRMGKTQEKIVYCPLCSKGLTKGKLIHWVDILTKSINIIVHRIINPLNLFNNNYDFNINKIIFTKRK